MSFTTCHLCAQVRRLGIINTGFSLLKVIPLSSSDNFTSLIHFLSPPSLPWVQAAIFTHPDHSNIPWLGLLMSTLAPLPCVLQTITAVLFSGHKYDTVTSPTELIEITWLLPHCSRKKSKVLSVAELLPHCKSPFVSFSLVVSFLSSLKVFLSLSPATEPLHLPCLASRILTNLPSPVYILLILLRLAQVTFLQGSFVCYPYPFFS